MKARHHLATLCLICTFPAFAAEPCPPTGQRIEWSAQCFMGKGDSRRVKREFVRQLQLNQYGMTTILIDVPRELVAVDRDGKVVIPDIRHTGDFDYPTARRGIGRFYDHSAAADGKQARCGYFEAERFRIIAPARFDHCEAFKETRALACTNCMSYCSEPDCQNRVLVGGQGIAVARDGTQSMVSLPTQKTICSRPDLVRISQLDTGTAMLRCLNGQSDPFSEL